VGAMTGEEPQEDKTGQPQQDQRPVLAKDLERRRKRNSIVLALILFAFVVLVFIITIVRLGGNVFNNPAM
jgi:accessory gene regulator protein AgrB